VRHSARPPCPVGRYRARLFGGGGSGEITLGVANTNVRKLQLPALLAAVITATGVHAQTSVSAPALACVAPEKLGCGCHIRLANLACPNPAYARQPQLFTDLAVDAPLLLVLDGEEQALPHVKHVGSSIKGDPPGRSTDVYRSSEMEVQVRYSPARSTCPKTKIDGCEYTDVQVEIQLSLPRRQRSWLLKGSGTCGC
jgi:hypothetical protein